MSGELSPRVSGAFRYSQDQERAGMLFARLVRSPHAHARVRAIDTSGVPPGVVVLTPDDLADLAPAYGPMVEDQPVLAREPKHIGDLVAAVAAPSERLAQEAADQVQVDYEQLPAVFEPWEALAPGAPTVHPALVRPAEIRSGAPNICHTFRLRSGDGEAGFGGAAIVVDEEFQIAGAAHVPMEPHACLAWWDAGRLHVLTGTQTPFNLRRDLSRIFHLAEPDVRVEMAPMGGSFGAKTFDRLEPVTAALARRAGRPVRTVLTRAEEFVTLNRHPARFRIRLGARQDGTMVAKRIEAWWDTGAYADCGPSVATKGGYAAVGPYRIPHVALDSHCVYTNRPPNGAFRGYAATQAVWASERVTDMLADRLGMDPLELRLHNLLRDGDRFATGEVMQDVRFAECLRAAADAVGWDAGHRGKGLAVMLKGMQTPSRTEAWLEVAADGRVMVSTGTADMGQRPLETQRRLAANALGIGLEEVTSGGRDTDHVPYDTRTTSSRSTFMMSYAIAQAATELRARLAAELEAAPEDVVLGGGRAWVAGSPDHARPLASWAGLRAAGSHSTPGGLDPDTGQGVASSHWHQAAASAEVAVDPETGVIAVARLHSVAYAGRVVDRLGAELQNEGSTVFGIGTAFMEQLAFDGGEVTNANLSDYAVPSMQDAGEFTYELMEGGTHCHGLGEMAVPVVPAALGNAVATTGHPVRDLPMTPEAVLRSAGQ